MVFLSYILMFLSSIAFSGAYYIIFVMGKNHFYENIYMLMHSVSSSGTLSTLWASVWPCLWRRGLQRCHQGIRIFVGRQRHAAGGDRLCHECDASDPAACSVKHHAASDREEMVE